MRESKLIKLLQTLEKKEFGKLSKYVKGPYFTEDESVIQFYDYLAPHYPKFDKPALDKEKVFDHLYPKKKYDDITLRHLRSKLLKIVEQYLIQIHFEKEDLERKRLLTRIYGNRNHYVEFVRSGKKLLSSLKNLPTQHPSHLFHSYSLCEELYFHQLSNFTKHTEYLIQAVDNLDQFYFLERTKLLVEVKNREQIYNEDFNIPLIPNYAPKPSSIVQNLLGQVVELMDKNQIEQYHSTKKNLFDNYQYLSIEHNQLAYRCLSNFIVSKLRIEETIWIPEYLELINWGVQSSILLINNIIHDVTFMNFIMLSLKINDYEACEKFKNRYQSLLDKTVRSNIISLADSQIHFQKKEYKKVLPILNQLNLKLPLQETIARTTLLRSYYHLIELGDSSYIQPLLNGCDTFKTYLNRSQLGHEKKSSLIKFTAFLKLIVKHRFVTPNPKNYKKMVDEFHSSIPISFRGWLLDIIKIQEG